MDGSSVHALPRAPDPSETQWESVDECDAVEYSSETNTYRTSFDSTTDSVVQAVVTTVAVVAETHPLELPPLYSVVDPEAFEAVIESIGNQQLEGDKQITFSFNDFTVTVHSYGVIAVEPPE